MGPKYIEIYDLVQASPDEYLMHHGIKNQKWGVRRGPPYPLQSGIRTKIKKVTKAAEQRAKENQAKRAAKTAAKKDAAAAAKERKQATTADKKETLQDKIDKMSDAELITRTNRLRLENAYRKELPNEEKGKNFIQKAADLLNTLKTGSDALTGFINSAKDLGKVLGLVEDSVKNADSDYDWKTRKPGETAQQYSQRLNNLNNIRNKLKQFAKEDRQEAERKAAEAAAAQAKKEAENKAAEAAVAEAQKDLDDFRRRYNYWR